MNKPVFPQTERINEKFMDEFGNGRTRIVSVNKGGLELRDYFAAMAMQGLLSNSETNRAWGVNENAKYAYEQADAMIKQRGKNGN